jgi:hypothetical protein
MSVSLLYISWLTWACFRALDFTPSTEDQRSFAEDAPVIVVTHGLTGGHYLPSVKVIHSSSYFRLPRVIRSQYPGSSLHSG